MRALIAVDGSVNAAVVMEGVAPWLRASGSTAEVITVLDESEVRATYGADPAPDATPRGSWAGSALPVSERPPSVVEARSQALERVEHETLERLRALVEKHLADVECEVRVIADRHVPSAIIAEARRANVDTIAMGTRGRGNLTSALLGGSAHQVVMAAPVPVFLVRT